MDKRVNNLEQICYVKRLEYTTGREKGEEILLVNNGRLQFTLLVNHALDIYDFSDRGTNISFITKNGLYSANAEFESRFNGGMLYTCGLDTVGGRAMPIHGRIHNVPSEIESIKCDEEKIEIIGNCRQCGLFIENLGFRRTITTYINSDKVEIKTEIQNLGHKDADYCVLFHMNVGYPMLDDGVEIKADVIDTEPRTENAKLAIKDCMHMTMPKDDEIEQVYFHTVKTGLVKVVNQKLNKVLTFEYDNKVLPYFIEWKSMVSGDYALGIEPSTTTLEGDFKKNTLRPNEKVVYDIKLSVGDK